MLTITMCARELVIFSYLCASFFVIINLHKQKQTHTYRLACKTLRNPLSWNMTNPMYCLIGLPLQVCTQSFFQNAKSFMSHCSVESSIVTLLCSLRQCVSLYHTLLFCFLSLSDSVTFLHIASQFLLLQRSVLSSPHHTSASHCWLLTVVLFC